VVLTKPGSVDYLSKVTITKAKTTVLKTTLTQYGVLDISSVPSGVSNWVDGANSTEFTYANVDVISGNRLIQLMNNGYRSYSLHVPISSGKTTSVNVTLTEMNRQVQASFEIV